MKSYILQMDRTFSENIQSIVASLPPEITLLFNNNKLVLCGKTIRDHFEHRELKQLCFFCVERDIFYFTKTEFEKYGYHNSTESRKFLRFKNPFLKIDITYIKNAENVIDILEDFDFIIEKGAYYKGILILHRLFLEDLHSKKLTYCSHHHPKNSFAKQLRMRKNEGYHISPADLRMIELDISNKEQ